MEIQTKLRLNYWQIIFIGFGFLASSLAWAVYNAQVPLILDERFSLSRTLIGTIMTIDNFFGVILQPLIGTWSDNTHSRFGRRLPWIALGLPICALLFTLVPLQTVLWQFMLVIVSFNFIMALWRSPVVSIMPDVVPSPLRSEANGIINLMGGVGSIIAFYYGGVLSDLTEDKFYAFFMASIIMMLALILLFLFVRDPDSLLYKETHGILIRNSLANRWARLSQQQFTEEYSALVDENSNTESTVKQRTSLTAFLDLPSQKQKSLAALLIAIFAWFMGNNAIETFFTLFATNTYGISGGQATMMLAGFSLAFLLFAVPAGRIGHKFGRKRTILIGLIGFIIIFVLIIAKPSQMLLQFLLIIAGFFWAFININSLPMVLEFATLSSIGTFTGYYYMFSFSASIVSPIFYGFLQDIFQTNALLFVFALVCFIVAFSSFLFVKHGEEHL
ncbi:MFS transporter [Aerococcaceae bacterium DSM 109653]|uniref:MFS transporter n=1 Tax=Fundicoccus ignavus TaxID=2664442 RepID=A0A844C3B0_9LACT|nr:MFS transporter [Fundicoccus ignavus]MRI81991.1 MFS transporter [Fundicoccus ignavus]